MYQNLVITAAIVGMVGNLKSNPSADSAKHFNKSVGFFIEDKAKAIRIDSTKLVTLTPYESTLERNRRSKVQKWFLTENFEKFNKLPKTRTGTFLNP